MRLAPAVVVARPRDVDHRGMREPAIDHEVVAVDVSGEAAGEADGDADGDGVCAATSPRAIAAIAAAESPRAEAFCVNARRERNPLRYCAARAARWGISFMVMPPETYRNTPADPCDRREQRGADLMVCRPRRQAVCG